MCTKRSARLICFVTPSLLSGRAAKARENESEVFRMEPLQEKLTNQNTWTLNFGSAVDAKFQFFGSLATSPH